MFIEVILPDDLLDRPPTVGEIHEYRDVAIMELPTIMGMVSRFKFKGKAVFTLEDTGLGLIFKTPEGRTSPYLPVRVDDSGNPITDESHCGWGMSLRGPALTLEDRLWIEEKIVALYLYVERMNAYPFTQRRLSPNKARRVRGNVSDTSIVYLNRPPKGTVGTKGKGNALKFGYPRRHHRRTLRHERYSKHPRYRVYKGVEVKQSWAGPKTYRTHTRIYKLIEPKHSVGA